MGTALSGCGHHDAAADCFERAAEAAQGVEGAEGDRGAYLVNLGMARVRQGRLREALESCTRGYMLGKELRREEVAAEAKECVRAAKRAERKEKQGEESVAS